MALMPGSLLLASDAVALVLDDTGTYSIPPQPHFERLAEHFGGGVPAMVASFRLHVQLNTSAYVQRQARIYLSVSPGVDSPVDVSWTSNGVLLGGQLSAGQQRALLWTGRLTQAVLAGDIGVQLTSRAPWLRNQRKLEFHFELEATDSQ